MLRLFTLLLAAIAFIYAAQGFSFKPNGRDIHGNVCKPVDCGGKIKNCPYGYRKVDGCEICKCHDPCNPSGKAILCGANQKCFVDKTSSGNFVGRCTTLRPKRFTACKQKRAPGTCKNSFKRYFYNPMTNRCERFIYTGCGGNDNNFETRRHCQTTCVH